MRALPRLSIVVFVLTAVATGCSRERWPSPPPVAPGAYQKEHDVWLEGERKYLSTVLPVIGIWSLDGSTTYGGYRVFRPQAVGDGEWTILDFNFAYNPPCAYSTFTTCPLPPPENRLPVAVEAGLKQLPSASGYLKVVPAPGSRELDQRTT